jgi:hypothetical protein
MSSDGFAGHLIITWPKNNRSCVPGWGVAVTNAITDQPIVSALDLKVSVNVQSAVTAEMTMFTDADGNPLLGSPVTPVLTEDGENFHTGRFLWLVTEMRTTPATA